MVEEGVKKTKLIYERGGERPVRFEGPHGSFRYTDPDDRSRTQVVGPHGMRGDLEFGPAAPGPFREVVGHIDEAKVVFRYRPWGSVEPGRHAFEIQCEGSEYTLVARGRRPVPQLEDANGHVLARFGKKAGTAVRGLNPDEDILVALIAGSGLVEVTLPQDWLTRH